MGTGKGSRKWQYCLFPEKERAARFELVVQEAPEMMRRLQELPQADGTLDQAQEQLQDFYSVWRPFRVRATKCGQKGWLEQTFYATEPWKNYDALKKQSSRYRRWKQGDNQRRWREMSEDKREARRRKQREAKKGGWFNKERAFALAKRCLKDDPEAKMVTYPPVLRLIRKHVMPDYSERYMIDQVRVAIACHRWSPHDPASMAEFESTLKWCCMPGLTQASQDRAEQLKQLWRQWAREFWEASNGARFQEVLNHV